MPETFDPQAYGPTIAELLTPLRECELGPGRPNKAVADKLGALDVDSLFGGRIVVDREMADACLAGLWLYHDFLDESHLISQDIPTPTGNYWHGIMHRREPDYSNAKYWFRRVGDHPVFGPLRRAAAEIAQTSDSDSSAGFLVTQAAWDPFRFVDLCEAASRGRSASEPLCRQIQNREWELLFDYCYQKAVD